MLEANPGLRNVISDPAMLKMSMQAMKNPELMREAMQRQMPPRPPLLAANIAKQATLGNIGFAVAFLICLFLGGGSACSLLCFRETDESVTGQQPLLASSR